MQPGGELGSAVSPFGWFPPPLRPPLFCPPPPWEHGFWPPPDGYGPPPAWYPPAYQEPLRRPHGGGNGHFSQEWQGEQAPGFHKRSPGGNNRQKVQMLNWAVWPLELPFCDNCSVMLGWRWPCEACVPVEPFVLLTNAAALVMNVSRACEFFSSRNFPTLANIEKKKVMQMEKEERGEVLTTPQFGKMKGMWKATEDERSGQQGRQKRKQKRQFWKKFKKNGGDSNVPSQRNQNEANGAGNSTCEKEHEKQPALETRPCMKDVDPLSLLANSDVESDKDEAETEDAKLEMTVVPKQVTSALSSLSANYGSASESEPEEVSVKIATKVEENEAALRSTPQSPDAPQNPKLNQELPESKDTTLRSSNSNAGPPRVPDKRAKRTLPLLPKRRPTLLEMLLAQDIRHERNVILQCVRYIVRNDVFGLHLKAETEAKTETGQASKTTAETLTDKLDGSHCSCSSDLQLAGKEKDVLLIAHGEEAPIDQVSQMHHSADEEIWETPAIHCEEGV
uniref:Nuclear FMR1 interacting protein 1 n=1 Tax=Pavo cristatus TaxID=9049 RepID=A0A8C9FBI2_PAVCR